MAPRPGACVWITRAEPGASETAARVRALGLEPVVEPVLAVQTLNVPIDLSGIEALAFTSANGVRAFAELRTERGLPVFTVGDATAEAARRVGFGAVTSAGGDVSDLRRLLEDEADGLAVLHPGARDLAGDLGDLVRPVAVYETVETEVPAPADVAAILVHSPRGGRAAARAAGAGVPVFAISAAAAAPFSGHAAGVFVADRPSEEALLSRLASVMLAT